MTDLPTTGALSVLVVDDDPDVRHVLVIGLRRAGFDVIEAGTGPSALEIVATETVAIVVCDVRLPGMSGIEVARELRARPETATLPIILVTGSGDDQTVLAGLEAGADDFLAKPVRIDELVARVRAHLRTHAAWSVVLEDELVARAGVVAALGSMQLSGVPEESAQTVVAALSRQTDSDFVSVAQVTTEGRMQELATFNRRDGVRRGGDLFSADLAGYLLGRAGDGPWVEEVRAGGPAEPTTALRNADLDLVASAPIFAGEDLVGLLSIGAVADAARSTRSRQAKLLAAAIDYASVLSAIAGSSIAGQRDAAALRGHLQGILVRREFHVVFQPIVNVETRVIVGFEALSRFDDGTAPDARFAEATRADLGSPFELAAIRTAIQHSRKLSAGAFLSVNLSPRSVIDQAGEIRDVFAAAGRPMVVELTEHVMIDDYPGLREAVLVLGPDVRLAVDDAGAGFASMRHILELHPSFAKLDISLVRGIDGDDLRQALAAGLNFFGLRTGCRLIAEGVETAAEASTLQHLGIELAQGYLYGRPRRPRTWHI